MISTVRGDGIIIALGRQFEVSYRIDVSKTSSTIRADGVVVGLDLGDHFALISAPYAQLRMQDGTEVEIIFLGGRIDGPARIAVNSRMPGF